MVAESAAAVAMLGVSPSATIMLGPCVDAINPGLTVVLMRFASARAPVKRQGVGANKPAGKPAAASAASAAFMTRCCCSTVAEQKLKYAGSTPSACSSCASSAAQR